MDMVEKLNCLVLLLAFLSVFAVIVGADLLFYVLFVLLLGFGVISSYIYLKDLFRRYLGDECS